MTAETDDNFKCLRCGQCCREAGFVYLTEADVDRIADYLDMSIDAFMARYTRLVADRRKLSLIENDDDSCIFLDARNHCEIQAVKPLHCKAFPGQWRYRRMSAVCEGWNAHLQSENHDAHETITDRDEVQ